jgi:hypothetical protein
MNKFAASAGSNSVLSKRGGEHSARSAGSEDAHLQLRDMAQKLLPLFGRNWHRHSLVALKAESLSRILYYNELYRKVLDVPGVICEFGVQWGSTLSLLSSLRAIYEPYNSSRTIYGFDTFKGFVATSDQDGGFSEVGDYASTEGYAAVLDEILSLHEAAAPLPHIKKFELVEGDATQTIDGWLDQNPHAIVSMAIFDMDLYEPTKQVLEKILPRLCKGSLLVFDELNCRSFPGETTALREVIGLNHLRLHRTPLQVHGAWAAYGD